MSRWLLHALSNDPQDAAIDVDLIHFASANSVCHEGSLCGWGHDSATAALTETPVARQVTGCAPSGGGSGDQTSSLGYQHFDWNIVGHDGSLRWLAVDDVLQEHSATRPTRMQREAAKVAS